MNESEFDDLPVAVVIRNDYSEYEVWRRDDGNNVFVTKMGTFKRATHAVEYSWQLQEEAKKREAEQFE